MLCMEAFVQRPVVDPHFGVDALAGVAPGPFDELERVPWLEATGAGAQQRDGQAFDVMLSGAAKDIFGGQFHRFFGGRPVPMQCGGVDDVARVESAGGGQHGSSQRQQAMLADLAKGLLSRRPAKRLGHPLWQQQPMGDEVSIPGVDDGVDLRPGDITMLESKRHRLHATYPWVHIYVGPYFSVPLAQAPGDGLCISML